MAVKKEKNKLDKFAPMTEKLVLMSGIMLAIGGAATIGLQINLFILDSDAIWTQVSSGIWSGAISVCVGILAMVTSRRATRGRMFYLIVSSIFGILAQAGSAAVLFVAIDDACPDLNVNDCTTYALDFLFITIINVAEVPFLMVLIMAGGCCGPPDMKIIPKKKEPLREMGTLTDETAADDNSAAVAAAVASRQAAAAGVLLGAAAMANNNRRHQHQELQEHHDLRNSMGIEPIPKAVLRDSHKRSTLVHDHRHGPPKPGNFSAYLSGTDDNEYDYEAERNRKLESYSPGGFVPPASKNTSSIDGRRPSSPQQQTNYHQSVLTGAGVQQQGHVEEALQQQQHKTEAAIPVQEQQPKPDKEDKFSAFGKAALGGALGATALGQIVDAVKEEEEDQEEPTVAEELVADVAEAATGAVLDAVKSGEFDAEALGEDLASAGLGAVAGALMNSKNKKAKKLGKGFKLFGKIKEAKEAVEENVA